MVGLVGGGPHGLGGIVHLRGGGGDGLQQPPHRALEVAGQRLDGLGAAFPRRPLPFLVRRQLVGADHVVPEYLYRLGHAAQLVAAADPRDGGGLVAFGQPGHGFGDFAHRAGDGRPNHHQQDAGQRQRQAGDADDFDQGRPIGLVGGLRQALGMLLIEAVELLGGGGDVEEGGAQPAHHHLPGLLALVLARQGDDRLGVGEVVRPRPRDDAMELPLLGQLDQHLVLADGGVEAGGDLRQLTLVVGLLLLAVREDVGEGGAAIVRQRQGDRAGPLGARQPDLGDFLAGKVDGAGAGQSDPRQGQHQHQQHAEA